VDNRTAVREFLTSRRARITPAQAGLPAYGGNRRVPGLRREEAAMLSGLSVDYYTQHAASWTATQDHAERDQPTHATDEA
jgi:hypothetical protein